MSFSRKKNMPVFVQGLMNELKPGRFIEEASIKDINQMPKWKGNVNHETPTKYLVELRYYFKTLRISKENQMYIMSRAMITNAEGWFHLIIITET